jgi:hypothetical protein
MRGGPLKNAVQRGRRREGRGGRRIRQPPTGSTRQHIDASMEGTNQSGSLLSGRIASGVRQTTSREQIQETR